MPSPDLPHALATLIAGGAPINPASQNMTIVEVTPAIGAIRFPAQLPPLYFVSVLVGGRPGVVYATKYRVYDPSGAKVAEASGSDVPFTSQIKRANIVMPLLAISDKTIVGGPGTYTFELVIRDETVGRVSLDILRAPSPPGGVPPNTV
ncbi:MAG TPA: hypothetical protein VNJ51_11300 [Candidatus Dormibacteraeota bacterium]|nr:hypothetical protein [Candidatus Dormibacteraeota bacterium]